MKYIKQYMIIRMGDGRFPTVLHSNRKSAEDETKRLATINPGEYFLIFESTKLITYQNIVEIEITDEE